MTTLIFLLFVLTSVFCVEVSNEVLKDQVSIDAIKARNDLENMEEAVDEFIDNLEKPLKEKPNFLEKLKKEIANEIEKCDCGYLARKENLKVVITIMTIIFILLIVANAIIFFFLFSKAKKTC